MSNDPIRVGVLVSGRGSNLQAIMDAIERRELNARITVVMSDVESAYALERARARDIPALYISPGKYRTKLEDESEKEYIRCLKEHRVELVCLAGFMRILHAHFLNAFPKRILNIHPALLPAFPGLHAQKQAYDYGVKYSGCTVHFVDEGIDAGPIIIQAAVPVLDSDNVDTLAARILAEEHRIYPEAIRLVAGGHLTVEGRRVIGGKDR
jgi:phosphoribosylglycinamide formyltransferase-1